MQQREIDPPITGDVSYIDPFWLRILCYINNPQFMLFYVLLVRNVDFNMEFPAHNKIAKRMERKAKHIWQTQ